MVQRSISGQVIGSTTTDSHGERYDLGFWKEFVGAAPMQSPLHQNHDMSLPVCGSMSNMRIEPDPEKPGEHLVLADITYDDEKINPDGMGFSWSTITNIKVPEEAVDVVYLPYPMYNDEAVLAKFCDQTPPIGVGKWIKKGLEPYQISLLVSGATFALSPLWKKAYDEKVYPRLAHAINACKNLLWSKGQSSDLMQRCDLPFNESRVIVNFIPERGKEDECFGRDAIVAGLELAEEWLADHWEKNPKAVRKLVLVFSSERQGYRITRVHYEDESVLGDGFGND